MQEPHRRANVKWFSTHQKGKRKRRSPMQLVGLRLNDLAKLFRSRYGTTLPDDDAGRDDLMVAVHHLASLAHPRGHMTRWLEVWAPWLTIVEQKAIMAEAIANPQRWTADGLAWRLRLTKEQRTMLGITTIGAIDESKAMRAKRRKQLDRQRKENARRAQGIKPRATYEHQSLSKAKPWEVEGISRASWYRRRKQAAETTPPRETTPATA
ncbi:MAG: hypothetical protein JWQ01_4927 [Massilia sp.]|nr:hypothetical protein [Massilia sp.]